MAVDFPYEEGRSDIFPIIKRPVAEVFFWSKLINGWLRYKMIVDTGADYTILPKYRAVDLGIDLQKDCTVKKTAGVGGSTKVFFFKSDMRIKIGRTELHIPLGFLDSNDVPPLLGRERCLNAVKVCFNNYKTQFD